jgi:hypothetical protein
MDYIEIDDIYRCPECGAEVWPKDTHVPTDEIEKLMFDKRRNHKPKECLPAGEAVPGGGSSNHVKKPKSKKLSLYQLNIKLHNEV